MSGFIHPDRQKDHARQDARQRFLDRKQAADTRGDERKDGHSQSPQPKWQTETGRQRASRWGQERSSDNGGVTKKEEEREQEGSSGSGAFIHPDRLPQVRMKAQRDEAAGSDRDSRWQHSREVAHRLSESTSRPSSLLQPSSSSPHSQPHERQWRRPPASNPHDNNSWEPTKDTVKNRIITPYLSYHLFHFSHIHY